MQLVENQITSFQGLSVPPSQALNTLRQVFVGIRMGGSSVQNTRPIRAPGIIIPGGNLPPTNIAEATPPTQGADNQDTMMLDQQGTQPINNIHEITPVSSNAAHIVVQAPPSDTQQLQIIQNANTQGLIVNSKPLIQPASVQHASTQHMLQFTHLNIQQTQVQV